MLFYLGVPHLGFDIPILILHAFQVNGDSVFMTSNFKEFKVESHSSGTWDEQNAMASTAVCISFLSTMLESVINGYHKTN